MSRIAETLGSCHPIFRAFPKSVHVFEAVQKLNSHGALDDRYLVVSTSGIFLLTSSSIKRSYQVSRFIPMIELESIKVARENSTFASEDVYFTIVHKDHVKFAATAYSVYCALFNHKNLEVNVSIDKSRKDQFDEMFYPLNTDSILAERFLGGILTNRKAIFDEDAMSYIYESLHNNVKRFEFTEKSNGNPLTYAIVSAVCFGDETSELVLNQLNLPVFFPYLQKILENSNSIRKVVFKGIKFEGLIPGIEKLFNEEVNAPVVEFEFNYCEFNHPDMNVLFSSFSTFRPEIKSLSFVKCQFCDQMLDSVFQSLFFHRCFHALETFIIDGLSSNEQLMEGLLQLSTCTWVLEKRCLKTLSVTNCDMDLAILLPFLCQVDTGILNLDLSGNMMTKPLNEKHVRSFHSVVNLVLSTCRFATPSAISSLFKCVSLQEQGSMHINLTSAGVDPQSWKSIYSDLSKLQGKSLSGLVWDNNPVTDPANFIKFIKKQEKLVELSLANSLNETSSKFIDEMATLTRLTSFCISCKKKYGKGPKIVMPLRKLLKNNNIEILDISGQGIGTEGMATVLRVTSTIRELRFDGFAPDNAEALIAVCDAILKKESITFAQWPVGDVKPSLAKSTMARRPELMRGLQNLRSKFIETYGNQAADEADSEVMIRFMTTAANTKPVVHGKQGNTIAAPKSTIAESAEAMEYFADYDEEILSYLQECGSVQGTDPMYKIFNTVKDETEITKLAAKLF